MRPMQNSTSDSEARTGGRASDPPDSLAFERRMHERHAAVGALEAVRVDGLTFPHVMQLQMIDESDGGIAARVERPLAPGSTLLVRTCPRSGRWRRGVVVRCTPRDGAWRLGVAFEQRRAAA